MSQLTLSSKNSVKQLSISAILTAFAILIPLMVPIKIIIGPASYTLASHIPLFIAMFISPATAIFVALGSSLGFFLAGFPIVIVFRALTHLFFLTVGAVLVKRFPTLMDSKRFLLLGIGLNLLHGLGEYIVVMVLTSGQQTSATYWITMFGLVGVGSAIHGLLDFSLAYYFWKILKERKIYQP
ncbi:TPA: hypothetical protein U1405_000740 [Streptococcus suis]|uniref:hypothetical protein n=1 Tax=Streptococcus suis TaxID=1307 RepID=UPI00022F9214|nr:hypothetical protein [Streptococcus suis]AER22255.1 conserved hypothetical protein [Streptococcus suis ST1]MDW8593419.1 hypothetical protein [Streptococcus suis]MDW8622753.1 hypothetical protein [Streptococcus suis]NQK01362.1 hypothetical protein [Streptococcus suis]NQK04228.1 hypothetical protein [Streptococcus suis]